eukprot:m.171877 g.171877  ORF g.171877 m.171877 type:complete len:209 (+) comp10395_c0_seq7:2618-3244(+)
MAADIPPEDLLPPGLAPSALDSLLVACTASGHLSAAERRACYEMPAAGKSDAPGIAMLEAMTGISTAATALDKAQRELQELTLEELTYDFTHTAALESKIELLQALRTHLGRIQEHRELLSARLRDGPPGVEEYIELEASAHSEFKGLMLQVFTFLKSYAQHVASLDRASHFQVERALFDAAEQPIGWLRRFDTVMQQLETLRTAPLA